MDFYVTEAFSKRVSMYKKVLSTHPISGKCELILTLRNYF